MQRKVVFILVQVEDFGLTFGPANGYFHVEIRVLEREN